MDSLLSSLDLCYSILMCLVRVYTILSAKISLCLSCYQFDESKC